MGCSSSSIELVIADDPSLLALADCFTAFQITPNDLHQFKKCFQKIDATKDGKIHIVNEFLYIYTNE
jgi:Ca2+-binding EF-hand superfamily protein